MSNRIQGIFCTIDTNHKLRYVDMIHWVFITLLEKTFDFEEYLDGVDIEENKLLLRFDRSSVCSVLLNMTKGKSKFKVKCGRPATVTLLPVTRGALKGRELPPAAAPLRSPKGSVSAASSLQTINEEAEFDDFYTRPKYADKYWTREPCTRSLPASPVRNYATTSGEGQNVQRRPVFCALCRRRLSLPQYEYEDCLET